MVFYKSDSVNGGFHKTGGTPKLAGWFFEGKIPIYQWMMTGGTPYFRKPPDMMIEAGDVRNLSVWGFAGEDGK